MNFKGRNKVYFSRCGKFCFIPLKHGTLQLDASDYGRIRNDRWYSVFLGRSRTAYARCTTSKILLHKLLLNPPVGKEVDHTDGDGLNCKRRNMRFAEHNQNLMNQKKQEHTSSIYKGVTWYKNYGCWRARIKNIHLGYFKSEEIAAAAYDKAAATMYGKFAHLNFG